MRNQEMLAEIKFIRNVFDSISLECGMASRLASDVWAEVLQDGDRVTVDAEKNEINVALADAELATRRAAFVAPPFKATRGTLAKYIRLVKSASEGCVTDES